MVAAQQQVRFVVPAWRWRKWVSRCWWSVSSRCWATVAKVGIDILDVPQAVATQAEAVGAHSHAILAHIESVLARLAVQIYDSLGSPPLGFVSSHKSGGRRV